MDYEEGDMSELTSMMNIGKEMARKLAAVGIDSSENCWSQAQSRHLLN